MDYSPWGHKESDTTERLSTYTHTHTIANSGFGRISFIAPFSWNMNVSPN